MSTHKHIDLICIILTVLALLLTVLFMNGAALGVQTASRSMGYEETLFDTSRVHTIDIVIDDWDAFIENCESETYSACSVVIDNEAVKNVGIRGKGNTSLSSVKSMGSERYSFKIEFDQYQDGKTYRGLDKLSLNNIIQDNTYMKDYLTYRLMDEFGVDTPLCSFVYITVNGEDWGLYLAVEGVEDSFLQRNYGRDTGELYKPDSMSFGGGGPGNGKGFNMDDFFKQSESEDVAGTADAADSGERSGFSLPGGGDGGFSFPTGDGSGFTMPSGGEMPDGFDPSQFGGGAEGFALPEGATDFFSGENGESAEGETGSSRRSRGGGFNFDFGGVFGGMGSSDVKLQYADDDPDSYSNIFNNAKTAVTKADQARLIEAIRKLNAQEDIETVVDVDEVIRYFVVHNYVCNGDSYTGSIIHNYYLHESDGQLSMIPWDYNLAFGTFQSNDATGTVNDPIDTPMSADDASDRPMWGWIISSEEYTQMYHEYFAEFLDSADVVGIIDEAYGLIKEYVAKDPTAFCTYEEFELGVATLRSFCEKRTESVRGQLDGTIPSTDAGQNADDSSLVDAGDITISDMGRQGSGGFGGGGNMPSMPGSGAGESTADSGSTGESTADSGSTGESGGSGFPSGSFGGGDMPSMPSGGFGGGEMPSMPSGGFGGSTGERGSGFPSGGFGGGEMPSMPSGGFGGSTGESGGSGFPSGSFSGGERPSRSDDTGSSDDADSGSAAAAPGSGGGSSGFPGGGFSGSMPSGGFGGSSGGLGQWATLAITLGVLILGLGFAILYKERIK